MLGCYRQLEQTRMVCHSIPLLVDSMGATGLGFFGKLGFSLDRDEDVGGSTLQSACGLWLLAASAHKQFCLPKC